MDNEFDRNGELDSLKRRLARLEGERETSRRNRRRLVRVGGAVCVVGILLLGATALTDPSSPLACLVDSDLYCFKANTPARARDVNHNFAQLKAWLVQKVGTVGNTHVAAGSADISGNVDVTGNVGVTGSSNYGSSVRQMINLYSTGYGIGVQGYTHYHRTGQNFAWYVGGSHNDLEYNPGGGQMLMNLDTGGLDVHVPVYQHACPAGYNSTSGFCYTGVRYAPNGGAGSGRSPHEAQQDCADEGADLCTIGQYYITDPPGSTCTGTGRCWASGFCSGTTGMYVTAWAGWNCVAWNNNYAWRCCRDK